MKSNEKFTQRAESAIARALEEAAALGHSCVGSEHLLLGILSEGDALGARVLAHGHVGLSELRNLTARRLGRGCPGMPAGGLNAEAKSLVASAGREARAQRRSFIGTEHLLLAILKGEDSGALELLRQSGADTAAIYTELLDLLGSDGRRGAVPGTARPAATRRAETRVLDQYSRDLTALAQAGGIEPVVCREREIRRAVQILCRERKNNPVLVGEPGVGKTAVAEGLALLMATGGAPAEYRRHIEKDAALERRFQPVRVEEPDRDQTLGILRSLRPSLERHHRVRLSDEALESAVALSVRYLPERFLPDKAIDLLDEAAAAVHIEGLSSLVDAAAVQRVLSAWTDIPVTAPTLGEADALLDLAGRLKRRVIGQDAAADAVARAVCRRRVGLGDERGPVGSFLFLGPSGVGKTELCRALAAEVYGDEKALIRLDMSEYMEKHAVSRILGSPPGYVGYEDGGQLTEQVRRRPWSVVLFDEIEKAHPDVLDILLQIMDAARLSDSTGRTVDFHNTLLVMTSNVGAAALAEGKGTIGFSASPDGGAESRALAELRSRFKAEFLNRLDETVLFRPLDETALRAIAARELRQTAGRFAAIGVKLRVSEDALGCIARQGGPRCGARPLRRAVRRMIEDPAAELLLSGAKPPLVLQAELCGGEIRLKKTSPDYLT